MFAASGSHPLGIITLDVRYRMLDVRIKAESESEVSLLACVELRWCCDWIVRITLELDLGWDGNGDGK